MPKPPSKHGLEKKFKPWRRGKSKTASTSSSLKQQLRGQERLLAKLPEDDAKRREELVEKILQTKAEIAAKEAIAKERKNATKSHGVRFLERQRLVRMEKAIRNSSNDEKGLLKLALDQVYVAHFPHDIKYLPLFKKGNARAVDQGKSLFRRAVTRNRILKELRVDQRVKWISQDQYERLPKSWTIQMEQEMFGVSEQGIEMEGTMATSEDDRFALTKEHENLLEAAEQIERSLNQSEDDNHTETSSNNDSDAAGSDSSDDDRIDPLKMGIPKSSEPFGQGEAIDSDEASSTDDSGDDSSSGSDSSTEDSQDVDVEATRGADAIVVDDFFMPATDENIFALAKSEKPSEVVNRGDKSKGWTTQRQRPGQFKAKRQRQR